MRLTFKPAEPLQPVKNWLSIAFCISPLMACLIANVRNCPLSCCLLWMNTANRKTDFLRLNEIYNLNLPADLVMLSACQTGLGKEIRGEGLVGLTRGFMYAGAARVGTSLWKVDDSATAALMGRFYQGDAKRRKITGSSTENGATGYVVAKALAIALLLGGFYDAGRMEMNESEPACGSGAGQRTQKEKRKRQKLKKLSFLTFALRSDPSVRRQF